MDHIRFEEALSHHQAGRLDEAERLCRRILATEPRHAGGLNLLGVIGCQTGRPELGIDLIEQAITVDGGIAEYHSNLGVALMGQGRLDAAIASGQRAFELAPGHIKALTLGIMFHRQGRLNEAISWYTEALRFQPDYPEALNNLGLALRMLGRLDEAVSRYAEALRLRPDYVEAHTNLGLTLQAQGRLDEAIRSYSEALRLKPDSPDALNNLGVARQEQGRLDDAIALYSEALRLKADYQETLNNLGWALHCAGRVGEAITHYRKALELNPDYADAHHNLALALLLTGESPEGWQEHEWRFRAQSHSLRPFLQPRWTGEDLHSRKLLVWGEQGVGDEIMFFSLLAELTDLGATIVVECDPRLVPLLVRSLPRIEVVARQDPPDPRCVAPDIDFQVPVGSLVAMLGPSHAGFRPPSPYLRPDPILKADLRRRYGGDGPVIGLSWWSGNRACGRLRTLPLSEWTDILALPEFRFVCLQYGDHAAEIEAFGGKIIVDPDIDPLRDMDGFAAQVAAMDLIISVDNSTVHMAGALGVPVWAMLASPADWRWRQEGEGSPWYPSARLFRQPRPGDWESVTARVRTELCGSSFGRPASPPPPGRRRR